MSKLYLMENGAIVAQYKYHEPALMSMFRPANIEMAARVGYEPFPKEGTAFRMTGGGTNGEPLTYRSDSFGKVVSETTEEYLAECLKAKAKSPRVMSW